MSATWTVIWELCCLTSLQAVLDCWTPKPVTLLMNVSQRIFSFLFLLFLFYPQLQYRCDIIQWTSVLKYLCGSYFSLEEMKQVILSCFDGSTNEQAENNQYEMSSCFSNVRQRPIIKSSELNQWWLINERWAVCSGFSETKLSG